MMRVLYISANGFPSSSTDARGAFSLEHAQALRALGLEVAAVDLSRDCFGDDHVDGLPVARMPRVRPMLRALDFRGVRRYLREFRARKAARPDAVIFSFFYLKYIPYILYLRARGRVILVIAHGGEVMPGGPLRRLCKRWMFRLVDAVTPVSEFTEAIFSCLVGRRNSDNRRIVTIHNGVDAAKLRPTVDRGEMRGRLGLPEGAFVVLSICNLVPRKGIDILVQALVALAQEGRDVRHVVVGRGPERDRLAALAAAKGCGDRFSFVDAVEKEELANYYTMADLFALVSVTDWESGQVEGFGITYAEAMALGRPVIGGGGSGTATPIKHGLTGWLVDPYSPEVVADVAAAVRRFIDDRELYERVAAEARRYVGEQFSWAGNAERTRVLLEALRRGPEAMVKSTAGPS